MTMIRVTDDQDDDEEEESDPEVSAAILQAHI